MTRQMISGLVAAAGGYDDDMAATIDAAGIERVADLAVSEMLHRADLPARASGEVSVRLHHDGSAVERTIHVDGGTATLRRGTAAGDATVTQSLVEVVRGLFGPRGPRTSATRTVRWRDHDEPDGPEPGVLDIVRRLLDAVDRPYDVGLAELCVRFGSDKWGTHQYAHPYERHLGSLRDRALTVLEVGVGGYGDPHRGGSSLRVWKRYFPRSWIYGMDLTDKSALSGPRVTVLQGDQSSETDLRAVLDVTGPPDVVIDDGSHVSGHVLATFRTLFGALREGGLYVVEDLQTSYWPSFGGRSDTVDDPTTTVGFLKQLVDGLQHEDIDGRERRDTDPTVGGLHFYRNLAVIEKAVNTEGPAPSWIPRS